MGLKLDMNLSPGLVYLILGGVLAVVIFFGYRAVTEPERFEVSPNTHIKFAKEVIEKPHRERMLAEGLNTDEIDRRIEQMWEQGELKLPEGEPGLDWAGRPGAIVIVPDPEDVLKGADLPAAPHEPARPAPPG